MQVCDLEWTKSSTKDIAFTYRAGSKEGNLESKVSYLAPVLETGSTFR